VCITKYARLYKLSNGKKIIFIVMVNHVVKFGKYPIYRTKVIVRKPVWTPTHPPAIPNHIIRPVSGI